ncbi:MAG: hypothetical protein ABIR57_00465 [Aeromicrobium sp.]
MIPLSQPDRSRSTSPVRWMLDPGEPTRTGEELRAYLRRWVAPALRS